MIRVYFILDPTDGLIKIGVSRKTDARLRTLADHTGRQLVLLKTIVGSYALEKELHRALARHRVRGEWFLDCPEVRSVMDAAVDEKEPRGSMAKNKTDAITHSVREIVQSSIRILAYASMCADREAIALYIKRSGLKPGTVETLYRERAKSVRIEDAQRIIDLHIQIVSEARAVLATEEDRARTIGRRLDPVPVESARKAVEEARAAMDALVASNPQVSAGLLFQRPSAEEDRRAESRVIYKMWGRVLSAFGRKTRA